LPACPVRSASRSLKVVATALKEHGAYAPAVGAATRCLRTGCWRCDTSPQFGNCGAPQDAPTFTKVNFRCACNLARRRLQMLTRVYVRKQKGRSRMPQRKRIEGKELHVDR
jgi:hypothetical protein